MQWHAAPAVFYVHLDAKLDQDSFRFKRGICRAAGLLDSVMKQVASLLVDQIEVSTFGDETFNFGIISPHECDL